VPNRLRLTSFAVLAFAVLPVLSACSSSPGSAAVVGSQRITTGQLQSQVNASLAGGQVQKQQGFDRTAFTRELLSHMISVQLINALATAHHVTVTPQDISAQTATFVQEAGGSLATLQQQAAQGGVTKAQLPGFIRYAALQQKIGTALTAGLKATPAQLAAQYKTDIDQYDQLDIAEIAVASKADANQILAKVRKNPGSFAALAKQKSLDTASASKGGEVGFVGRSQVEKVAPGDPLKPGTFVVASANGQYVVLHIIKRRTKPLSDVTSEVQTAFLASEATGLVQKAAAAEATKLGVHVSPRYGHWDSASQSVVAASSPVSSSGSSTPSPSASPTG
jgi:PPIC-type PPIASE domain/SurA N-terminal domain